jgi:hypothetical protein
LKSSEVGMVVVLSRSRSIVSSSLYQNIGATAD